MLEALLQALVFPGLFFSVTMAFWFEYIERKITARVQTRVGPLYAGPKGLLQPVYDFLKLLGKEELIPRNADPLLFQLAPVIAVTIPVFGMTYIPVASTSMPLSFQGDVLLVLLLLALSAFTIALAGYSATTPYTSLGVGRLLIQYSMYESVFALCIAAAAVQASALSLEGIVTYQALHGPLALYQPIGFAVALIALLAKLEKRPFDLPHAKQEIAAGWQTEFSGRSLAYLRLYSDLSMTWGISLVTTFYLGGPLGPGYPELGPVAGFLWFGLKALLVSIAITLVSASSGRIRAVGLARRFWGRLFPLTLIQLVLAFLLRWFVCW
ncbi:complex I subunit 1/NuoH family protein [Infirmifilum sp. NZ]|uniref:complex I subunit 1/NuoH family protein n=1 Tax=Infirmifilum sp. NZ TaxID=2926850 RepID=UPI0027AA184F|nr:complex I subunit 1 family protein [Infirmifilum sp. NZ]UNQ73099.1 NADH-quinone oxidoreductase subunit H [Infirmifilum sp. NZ]